MKITIDDPARTLTFCVHGDSEDLVVIKKSLDKLPHFLVGSEISNKTREGEDNSIIITCPFVSYNYVINLLQDFITDKY